MKDIFAKLDALRKKEDDKASVGGSAEYIIVGLGNPENKYDNTRHNIGFRAVDKVASDLGVSVNRSKFKSVYGTGCLGGVNVVLLKPLTYMNLSGQAVVEAMNFYKIPLENVIVIYDDVSLAVGKIRIRGKGSHGGHNGIRNIIELCGSDSFPRIKIGVGEKPHKDYNLADWVLGNFSKEDNEVLLPTLNKTKDICQSLICEDIQKTMGKFNG